MTTEEHIQAVARAARAYDAAESARRAATKVANETFEALHDVRQAMTSAGAGCDTEARS